MTTFTILVITYPRAFAPDDGVSTVAMAERTAEPTRRDATA